MAKDTTQVTYTYEVVTYIFERGQATGQNTVYVDGEEYGIATETGYLNIYSQGQPVASFKTWNNIRRM